METHEALQLITALMTFCAVAFILLAGALFVIMRRTNWVYARHLALRERHECLTRNVDGICELLNSPSDPVDDDVDDIPSLLS